MDIDDYILNEKNSYVEINSHVNAREAFLLRREVLIEAPLDRIPLHVYKGELFCIAIGYLQDMLLVICNSHHCKIAQRQLTNQITPKG